MAKKKRSGKTSLLLIIVLIIVSLFGLGESGVIDTDTPTFTNEYLDGEVYVHFIDVGQGSSTLIQQGKNAVLIDSGLSEYGETVSDFITSCGVETLSYVIATHPHNDHIGSITEVMDNFEVGEIIMPELSEINTPTTRVYENFIDYIIERDIPVNAAQFNDVYSVEDINIRILGPVKQNKDLNNMSVVCRITAGDSAFMFLGDAETEELESINKYCSSDISSDVLLMGHHGSSTSVYEPFLDKVNADIAVISCGKNNSYNHPHEEALEYCEESGMDVYRTDLDGTVSFRCTQTLLEKVS